MSSLALEIISPQGLLFQGDCHMVVLPSAKGEMGIMYGHEPIVAMLADGQIKIYDDKQEVLKHFDISSGFVEMNKLDRLTILLDDGE